MIPEPWGFGIRTVLVIDSVVRGYDTLIYREAWAKGLFFCSLRFLQPTRRLRKKLLGLHPDTCSSLTFGSLSTLLLQYSQKWAWILFKWANKEGEGERNLCPLVHWVFRGLLFFPFLHLSRVFLLILRMGNTFQTLPAPDEYTERAVKLGRRLISSFFFFRFTSPFL